jgi:outer membrane protein
MQTGASLSLEQQKAKEADLQKRKDEIEHLQEYKDQAESEFAKPLDDVQNKLNAFFKAFTKEHNYSSIITFTVKGQGALGVNDELDVTNQIIKGLNDAYHEELQKNPSKK